MYRQRIETWLQNASLPGDIPTSLNEQGLWTVTVDDTDLTLALNEEQETLFLCATLISLDGTESPHFYRKLISLQSQAQLPPGVMFGLDEEENILMLFGHLDLKTLDTNSFQRLLENTFKAMAYLPDELKSLQDMTREATTSHRETLACETIKDLAEKIGQLAPETPNDNQTDNQDHLLEQSLTDEELLRLQMMQPIRF